MKAIVTQTSVSLPCYRLGSDDVVGYHEYTAGTNDSVLYLIKSDKWWRETLPEGVITGPFDSVEDARSNK